MAAIFAKVVVDIANSNIDRIYEYLVPQQIEGQIQAGMRVCVPFGYQHIEGFVIGISSTCTYPLEKLRPIERLLGDRPVFTEEQLKLAYYIKKEYRTTLTFALRFMIPAELRGDRVKPKTQQIAQVIEGEKETWQALIQSCYGKAGQIKAPAKHKTLTALLEKGQLPVGQVEKKLLQTLTQQGLVQVVEQQTWRTPKSAATRTYPQEIPLNEEQQKAVEAICSRLGSEHRFLLHGVTGSGKTLVYIQVIRKCLAMGKTAILLVPEISLTPQMVDMFQSQLKEEVAVFHSGLSKGERYDQWRGIIYGKAQVVIGARSAVFAPLQNIGVIIIDEEHEQSYRADNHPRYEAAKIARLRCKLNGAVLVLGSATPSIETYYMAQKGFYQLVELKHRASGLSLPKVDIVDMRKELEEGNRSIFSGLLQQQLEQVQQRGEQAILFLNRRAYASFVMCRGCGYVIMCDKCTAPMKYHKVSGCYQCHHCGRKKAVSKVCPVCGKPYLKPFGLGTQQVVEALENRFPGLRVLRLDQDAARKKDAALAIYEQFKGKQADVLVGTQMVAKGLDFEDVTLSAIVSADMSLMMEDYHAAERTFSLLEQVAGRAGRKKPGQVLIQTYQPDHYAILCAAQHDYQKFFWEELGRRRLNNLPPYTSIFRFLVVHKDRETAKKQAQTLQKKVESMLQYDRADVMLFDTVSAPISRIEGKERFHFSLRVFMNKNFEAIKEKLWEAYVEARKQGVLVELIQNPYNMY